MIRTNPSILIVDDDEALRSLLSDWLGDRYWCETAACAEQAIALLKSGSFNLVLSDITMPGESGLDLCVYVQETCPHTAVVMMSAMTEIEYAVEAIRRGALDYITKPFKLSRLALAVDRALSCQQAAEDKVRIQTGEHSDRVAVY